jgi:Large ribosomal RNA subunit accumulation protein YceD
MSERPWSVPVNLHDIPETGRHFALLADETIRAAIAKTAQLHALPRLEATFDVNRRGSAGLHVLGRVSATVGQVCVVTLDPLESEIEESVDVTFLPGAAPGDAARRRVLDVASDDEPETEPLINDTIDLGAIATEFLLLGIDPYPRKPEAVFEAPSIEDGADHPFAALANLRKGTHDA